MEVKCAWKSSFWYNCYNSLANHVGSKLQQAFYLNKNWIYIVEIFFKKKDNDSHEESNEKIDGSKLKQYYTELLDIDRELAFFAFNYQ